MFRRLFLKPDKPVSYPFAWVSPWIHRMTLFVAPVGDFLATQLPPVSPRSYQEVTRKSEWAEPPTKVPTSFLPATFVRAAAKAGSVLPAELPLATGGNEADADVSRQGERSIIIFLEAIPTSENHFKHKKAMAALLLLWSREPRSRSVMEHEVFKADHAALRRKAASKRKSSGACSSAAVAASDGVARNVSPQPGGACTSSVLVTRAAARAAAGDAPPFATSVLSLESLPAPAGRAEGGGTKRVPEAEEAEEEAEAEDGPVTPRPAKRGRHAK